MNAKTRDRAGSVLLLAFVGALFAQRSYMTPFGGIFPDLVMAILAGLVLATLVLSFTSRPAMRDSSSEGEKASAPAGRRRMAVVGVVLLAWGILLRPLGFALTGVLGFTAISLYLADRPLSAGTIARSVAVAIAVTGVLLLVFGKVLQVPLPAGTIFM